MCNTNREASQTGYHSFVDCVGSPLHWSNAIAAGKTSASSNVTGTSHHVIKRHRIVSRGAFVFNFHLRGSVV